MSTPSERHHSEGAPAWSLWLGFFVASFVRAPGLFLHPRFFAEEGVVYFRYALDHGALDALSAPHIGYFALVPNVATWLATRVPLAYAPFVTLGIAFAIQSVPAWLVIEDRALFPTMRAKALALAMLVLPIATRRDWLSTIHAQFWLALATALILVVPPRNRRAAVFQGVVVLLAASTGAPSTVLFPLAWAMGWARRERRLLGFGLVLAVGAVAQFVLIADARSLSWHAGELVVVGIGKLVLLPFVGKLADPMLAWLFEHSHQASVIGPLAAFGIALAALLVRVVPRRARPLLAAGAFLGAVSILAALGDHGDLARTNFSSRYAFVPNVVLTLALVATLVDPRSRRATRVLSGSLAMLALIAGSVAIAVFQLRVPSGKSGTEYRLDAERYAHDPGQSLRIVADRCRLMPRAASARAGFAVAVVANDDDLVHFRIDVPRADRGHVGGWFIVVDRVGPIAAVLDDGVHDVDGSFFGEGTITTSGLCYSGPPGARAIPAWRRGRLESRELTLPRAAVESLASEDVIFVGVGRDAADALAKGTFEAFQVRELLGTRSRAP